MLGFAKLVSADQLTAGGVLATKERRSYYLMAREAMLGLALGRATNPGAPVGHERRVLDLLRTEAAAIDEASR